MARKRLVVETSEAGKAAIDQLLSKSQLTLTDWFDSKVCEETATYQVVDAYALKPSSELNSLEHLKHINRVMANLRKFDWSFEHDVTGYLSHSLHPYPAKFIPQIPGTLISALTLPGELVWDPFGGSGTTALEAALHCRRAISSDANPLGAIIGDAKTTTLGVEDEAALIALRDRALLLSAQPDPLAALERTERNEVEKQVPPIPNITDWFHENAIRELAITRTLCGELDGNARAVALAALSKIVLKASFQDGETRYTKRKREVAVGSVLRAYVAELNSAIAKVRQLGNRLRFRKPVFITADVRSDVVGTAAPAFILPETIALVVTSPPYPNANDYHLYHRFRLFWLGYDPRKLAHIEIGSHLRHQKEQNGLETYLDEMRLCLKNCLLALQSGRYAVFVIGDCGYGGKTYNTADHLAKIAKGAGFEVAGIIPRVVHATKRSFITPARRIKNESLLVLRKPPTQIKAVLIPPSYRTWAYEDSLREREVQALLGHKIKTKENGRLTITIDPYQVHRLKHLTFTHRIETKGYGQIRTWQAVLENGDANKECTRKDPKYVTHGIHAYKGKFYPQLAKSLFNLAGLVPGNTILDPYCGSGTVLLEAQLNGLQAVGCDINPLAIEIATAKCGILAEDPVLVDRLLAIFIEQLRNRDSYKIGDLSPFPLEAHNEISRWFSPKVIGKLAWCLRLVDRTPVMSVKTFLKVLLSSIIRDVSQQDPQDLRIRRRNPPITDAPAFELLEKAALEQRGRLHKFTAQLDMCPHSLSVAHAKCSDSRNAEDLSKLVAKLGSNIDAVVTSPPYATALPYIDTDRLSLLLLWGLPAKQRTPLEEQLIGSREISLSDRRKLEFELQDLSGWNGIPSKTARKVVSDLFWSNNGSQVGFRRLNMAALIYRYFKDMSQSLNNIDKVLNRNASVFIVIGDNRTTTGKGEVVIRTTEAVTEIGQGLGWKIIDRIPITVTKENLKHSHNSITHNTVLWFRRGS